MTRMSIVNAARIPIIKCLLTVMLIIGHIGNNDDYNGNDYDYVSRLGI